jgi:hypothetical protein
VTQKRKGKRDDRKNTVSTWLYYWDAAWYTFVILFRLATMKTSEICVDSKYKVDCLGVYYKVLAIKNIVPHETVVVVLMRTDLSYKETDCVINRIMLLEDFAAWAIEEVKE